MSKASGAPATAHEQTNRLIHETSPYLLQHAHNPVDWYPWGPEAFAKAQADDKPILLSIGYSACHWCHVMAHESFENPTTAQLMNEQFVNIKVDREERPDVDALYMDAVQAMTGNGGWPMTVFLTPDGAPFLAGTYFPPQDRYGMPGFPRLLRSVAELYATRRDEVERQAQEFRDFYQRRSAARVALPQSLIASEATLDPDLLDTAANGLLDAMDEVEGGFGRAPKFSHPMDLDFLLRLYARGGSTQIDRDYALRLVRLTLDKMAGGGIYDQVGGGFHRYSTDEVWLVPHFEKMLYDNALLAPVYLHAWQLTGDERYRHICEETLDYLLREMTGPEGEFSSTQDADSEGEEGRFYLWTADELRALLGERDAALAGHYWGVSERGNFEGRNILHVARPLAEVAQTLGMDEAQARETLARARQTLYAARANRVWPGRDDKALTAWNGWALRAFAEAARALDRSDYREAAVKNANFLLGRLVVDGRLRRTWRAGQARLDAYLEDYASLVNALLSVYETTGDGDFFVAARRLADELLDRFWEEEQAAFFDTARDAERLIGRPRELADNATPSGSSLAVEALLRLAAYTGEGRYREYALRVLAPLASALAKQPTAFGHLLCALDDAIGPFYEIAVVGALDDAATLALQDALARRYLPRAVSAFAAPAASPVAPAAPLLDDRGLVNGQPAAYICQSFVCKQPVTTPDALLAQLPG